MASTKLRPDVFERDSDKWCPDRGTAYLMVLNAVEAKRGLIHGQLHNRGESCAIGSYFDVNPNCAIPHGMTDEIAAVNDSAPALTMLQRKQMVARWLRWRLTTLGMPGFATKANPIKKS